MDYLKYEARSCRLSTQQPRMDASINMNPAKYDRDAEFNPCAGSGKKRNKVRDI